MSGHLITILPPTLYNLATVPASSSFEVPIATRVDISQFREALLTVRVHGATLTKPGSSTLTVKVYHDGSTDMDPAVNFKTTTSVGSLALPATTPNAVVVALSQTPLGAMLWFGLEIVTAAQGGAITFTMSVDLSVKS